MTYDPYDVPARSDSSRFAIDTSPTGIAGINPTQNVTAVYGRLLADRLNELTPVSVLVATVLLRKVAVNADGDYVLVDAGTLERPRTHQPVVSNPGTTKLRAGELLDSVFLGKTAWKTASPDAIWEAALDLARAERMRGVPLRELNVTIALITLARAGISDVKPWELPTNARS